METAARPRLNLAAGFDRSALPQDAALRGKLRIAKSLESGYGIELMVNREPGVGGIVKVVKRNLVFPHVRLMISRDGIGLDLSGKCSPEQFLRSNGALFDFVLSGRGVHACWEYMPWADFACGHFDGPYQKRLAAQAMDAMGSLATYIRANPEFCRLLRDGSLD